VLPLGCEQLASHVLPFTLGRASGTALCFSCRSIPHPRREWKPQRGGESHLSRAVRQRTVPPDMWNVVGHTA
jgi:hypothetical protein